MTYNLEPFVNESNAIEGIHREARAAETISLRKFIELPRIEVFDLETLAITWEPGVHIRREGHDVTVGSHIPPVGGPRITRKLMLMLVSANESRAEFVEARRSVDRLRWAFKLHCNYEMLHPFNDCNGRTGRALWLWAAGTHLGLQLSFLHSFYYSTLDNYDNTRV